MRIYIIKKNGQIYREREMGEVGEGVEGGKDGWMDRQADKLSDR